MTKNQRARLIIDHVLAKDERWGKPGAPREDASERPSRIISDEARWYARVTRADQRGADGELWDLIEISAYGEWKMVAAFRGEQLHLRVYNPGPWEAIFLLPPSSDPTPFHVNDDISLQK